MRTEIIVSASDIESTTRAFPWPVVESGNGSFPEGKYTVVCEDKDVGKSFQLTHSIQGASLIEKWADAGLLKFVCGVAAPISMYKRMHASSEPNQLIQWDREDLGEYPLFTPMIVTNEEIRHLVDAERDGVNHFWDGVELRLPKGARVAICDTFGFQTGLTGLFKFCQDDNLSPGRFRVEPSSEDGFKFMVHLSKGLFEYLQYHRQDTDGANIMVHVVSAALAHLQRDYSNDDGTEGWRSYRNLVGLAEVLEQKGLSVWWEDNFAPEVVATGLHPHVLPSVEN